MNPIDPIIIDVTESLKRSVVVDTPRNQMIVAVCACDHDRELSLEIVLAAPGATAEMYILVLGSGTSSFTLHTVQHHTAPDTTSNLLVKHIGSDASHSSFEGLIRIEKEAQHSDAYQRSESLLVSGMAQAKNKPELEILANDVRCTHGSVTKHISEEELWYLRSRGIGKDAGSNLLIDGFIEPIRSRIPESDLLRKKIAAWNISVGTV
jgi:Fe-S cluster assembly protein SufD